MLHPLGLTVQLAVESVHDPVKSLPHHGWGQWHCLSVHLVEEQLVEWAVFGSVPLHHPQGWAIIVWKSRDEQLLLGDEDLPEFNPRVHLVVRCRPSLRQCVETLVTRLVEVRDLRTPELLSHVLSERLVVDRILAIHPVPVTLEGHLLDNTGRHVVDPVV